MGEKTLLRALNRVGAQRITIDDNAGKVKGRRLTKGRAVIGVIIMTCSLLQMVIVRAASIADVHYCYHDIGSDIWNGVIAFIIGLLGVFSGKSKRMVVFFLVGCFVAVISAVSSFVIIVDCSEPVYGLVGFVLSVEILSCIIGSCFTCKPICCPGKPAQIIVYNSNRNDGEETGTILPGINDFEKQTKLDNIKDYSKQIYGKHLPDDEESVTEREDPQKRSTEATNMEEYSTQIYHQPQIYHEAL